MRMHRNPSASLLIVRQVLAFVSYIKQNKVSIPVPVAGTCFFRSFEQEHTQYLDQHMCDQGKAGGCQGICDLIKMLQVEMGLGLVQFSYQREEKALCGGLCVPQLMESFLWHKVTPSCSSLASSSVQSPSTLVYRTLSPDLGSRKHLECQNPPLPAPHPCLFRGITIAARHGPPRRPPSSTRAWGFASAAR